jgi:hypothetical protein
MRTIAGTGAWPGSAEGPVVWLRRERPVADMQVPDRAAEVLRFRVALGRALADLEAWLEQQQTVEGRLLLQGYRDALLEDAWGGRVCDLIDGEGLCAPGAAVKVAAQVSGVMARSGALQERAEHLRAVARWVAERLDPMPLPDDAILAGNRLSPLAVIDRRHPAITGGPEPPVVGGAPLVWGVREIGPHWQDKRIAIEGRHIRLDVPEPNRWSLADDQLNGLPVRPVQGRPETFRLMAGRLGRRPAALIQRLDDLAAVPLLVGEAGAVAVDLDRLGPVAHPGVRLLVDAAALACKRAGIPLVVGGEAANADPDFWFALGCTALFDRARPRGGASARAIRRGKKSSL